MLLDLGRIILLSNSYDLFYSHSFRAAIYNFTKNCCNYRITLALAGKYVLRKLCKNLLLSL